MTTFARFVFLTFAGLLTHFGPLVAQDPPIAPQTRYVETRVSQPARVTQRMGPTEITIAYGRPVARGRELFGALVPWDAYWNAGADDATRIEVDQDILVEGEPLPAGRYSLWTIPRASGEWTLIFSRAWEVQHRPYPQGEDFMRLQIRTQPAMDHMEALSFYFPVATADSATLHFHWGTTILPIRITRALPR
jgi:hypothetical protein